MTPVLGYGRTFVICATCAARLRTDWAAADFILAAGRAETVGPTQP